jgi:hypothetical protein
VENPQAWRAGGRSRACPLNNRRISRRGSPPALDKQGRPHKAGSFFKLILTKETQILKRRSRKNNAPRRFEKCFFN